MSRTLARLRETTGDEILVRAGRAMGPTPRALALRDRTLVVDELVLSYLRQRTLLSLAIDNPKYSGLQQARERWRV